MNSYTYSQAGLAMTEGFEGCRLSAYLDGRGIPTIGYGHTDGVQIGDTCTLAQAEEWLETDIQWAQDIVNRLVTVELTQQENDALVDFVFNVGSGNFLSSTLLKDLNAGNFANVASDMERWDLCAGSVCAGLFRRRVAESGEFGYSCTR